MKDDIIYKENNEISNETMRNITPKQERKMKKRILIVTNHSYMFWQFRKELVEALQKEHEVILAMPFVGHEEDFRKMGIECIPVSMNRRGVNPFAEAKLLRDYKRLLQKISPDFVLTYSIKPNIYMGLLCSCKKIPYYANVQGLGTAFQKPVLAGFFEDIYKKQVEELEQLGIAHFYGFQSDPRPFYAEADCVVLPSYHEGMSNVLLEAAATGRPVITSNIPGCRESVENGKSGLLVEVKNKEMLYQAMKKMLHCSREEREKMGKAGREKMKREFRKEAVVERTVRSLE